uniref:AMP deaminase 2 n=2 Tax=Meloidogyne enterolobii TaxID=390850 RepID=A0A6V7VH14_MELEN|nr:unnamed protein product [Meloidogyne enterolobii]
MDRKAGPYSDFASVDDDPLTDPIMDEEAKKVEIELARHMQKHNIKSENEDGDEGESARLRNKRESTDSGDYQNLSFGPSGHVISSPYELSHYPIEILECKNALQKQISSRLSEASSVPSNKTTISTSRSLIQGINKDRASSSLGHHQQQQQPLIFENSNISGNATFSAAGGGGLQNRRLSLQQPYNKGRLESIREQQAVGTSGAVSPEERIMLSQCSNSIGLSPTSPSGGGRLSAISPSAFAFAMGSDKLDDIDRELCLPQHVEMHSFRDAIDVNYQRMGLTGEELSGVPLEDLRSAARQLVEALRLRSEYMELVGGVFPSTTRNFLIGKYPSNLPKCRRKNTETSASMSYNPPEPPKDHWGLDQPLPIYEQIFDLERHRGTVAVIDKSTKEIFEPLKKFYITREKYLKDFNWLNRICNEGPLKTFCYRRLTFLQTHFQLHVLLNEQLESAEQRSVPHRDFYNIRKVDTHIHAASSMNHKHLLRFIKKRMRTDADEVVQLKNGRPITMREVFEKMGVSPYDLSVDMLDVHADRNTFHRFDKFNAKYNPVGQNDLREIFIKTDNYVNGRYFAQVLKEVFIDVEENKYQNMEPRLSIYGRDKDEWDKLANWAITHDVWSQNVRWMIQIPRLYDVYRSKNLLLNFDEFLSNIFSPLFEVTNDPNTHPELHRFLQHVSGLDSVDDESKHEHVPFTKDCPEPVDYTSDENPSYSYYLFYMYMNLASLNAFRQLRGLNTFALRPHCGEAGHVNHLSVTYLTSESIAHGLLLRKVPVLQYLFYLAQIGMAMSPLSNNHLFLTYHRNPMPDFLMKGLNVSLSTDDPLQFHITKEALMEEYSIAAQVWKLSSSDMCELARNSVLQSGFEDRIKLYWLGPNYREEGVLGNDVARTNVPDIRVSFRHESLVNELCNLFKALSF